MKCDKCGFEHNSKSTCPKCGANVVFVNEEYLRRRQEWEEQQKNGTGSKLPPGIMHSTREEYDIRTGRDRMIKVKEEGGSNKTSLSFNALKEKFVKFIARCIVKHNRRKQERKNSKPKKTPKKNRRRIDKRIIIFPLIVIAIGVTVFCVVRNVKIKKSREVVFYDGRSVFNADNTEKPIFTTSGDGSVFENGEQGFIVEYSDGFYICNEKKRKEVKISNPKIIACNESMNAVLFESEGELCFYDGQIHNLGIKALTVDKKGCMISDNGKKFVFTNMTANDDDFEYYMYYGDKDGVTQISTDTLQKIILDVYDKGGFIYLNMDNADYGIINKRAITHYDEKELVVLVEDFAEYRYIDDTDVLYYIDKDNYLYILDDFNSSKLDTEVHNFCDNMYDEGVFYQKADGCYKAGKKANYEEPLFRTNETGISLYYNPKDNYLYYADKLGVYFVAGIKNNVYGKKIINIAYEKLPIYNNNKSKLFATSAEGTLYELSASQNELIAGIDGFITADNADVYSYIKNSKRYVVYDEGKKSYEVSLDSSDIVWNKMVINGKKCYFIDNKMNLFETSAKNNLAKLKGIAKICIFIG